MSGCSITKPGRSSHSIDTDLSKVSSFDKQSELLDVLHSGDPSHYQRLWLVGFLKFVGYSPEEICSIIDMEACWGDYDATMTYNQVQSVFRASGSNTKGVSSQRGSWLNGDEWNKRYNKAFCTLHYVSCVECPDSVDHRCKWVKA